MIITRLIGGLGNQMLQYAFGRWIAHIRKTNLKLDITGYDNQLGITPRKYRLSIFNIQEDFATIDEIIKIKRLYYPKYLLKIINKLLPYYYHPHVIQKYFNYDPNVKKIRDNSYLDGYWFSEKYFIDIENIIRNDFTFKQEPIGMNKKILDEITNTNSISIHVRRGDYVNNPTINNFHGVCDLNYYNKAILYLTKKVENPHFFIFSDDIHWVKNNFNLKYKTTFVDNNVNNNDHEDLRLMSKCKHNIIANSTFSWWGAWLNSNKSKIVIAPNRWFKNEEINTKDILPDYWIKI